MFSKCRTTIFACITPTSDTFTYSQEPLIENQSSDNLDPHTLYAKPQSATGKNYQVLLESSQDKGSSCVSFLLSLAYMNAAAVLCKYFQYFHFSGNLRNQCTGIQRRTGTFGVVRSVHTYELFIILCFINSLVLRLYHIRKEKSSQPSGIVHKLRRVLADDFLQLLSWKLSGMQHRFGNCGRESCSMDFNRTDVNRFYCCAQEVQTKH